MKPVAIPDDMPIEGAEKTTISGKEAGAADVEALVAPVKMPIGDQEFSTFRFSMLLECDEVDLRSLQLDPRLWLHLYGRQIQPFMLDTAFVSETAPEDADLTKRLRDIAEFLNEAWKAHAAGKHGEARAYVRRIVRTGVEAINGNGSDLTVPSHISRTTGQDPGTASEHKPGGGQGEATD